MPHALVTVIAPMPVARVAEAQAAIDALENPASKSVRDALDKLSDEGEGIHFASLSAISSEDGRRAYLVLELSADGTEAAALDRVHAAIGAKLVPVFEMTSDWSGRALRRYLSDHRATPGVGWFSKPGLAFDGTPGMSVGRIRSEDQLAKAIAERLGAQPQGMTALARVDDVRSHLPGPLEVATPESPFQAPSGPNLAVQAALSLACTYLWPVGIALLAVAAVAGATAASGRTGAWAAAAAVAAALSAIWQGLLVAFAVLAASAAAAYLALRNAEARDSTDDRAADRSTNESMFRNENRAAQNHMISITQRKPGALRLLTLRLSFWLIGVLAAKSFRPGYLGGIGSIHFARWLTVPGGPDLVFLSNYGGSWESYLEDFITLAHEGLTAIWSNTMGFPRAQNLFQRGATDGARFKRFARRSMVPTRFWYSAYPDLTTAAIRTNAQIRRGASGAMTEDEAVRWLALFGSSARPPAKLVSSGIQSLVFGGLRRMPFGVVLVLDLPSTLPNARLWLKEVRKSIAFDDGRRLCKDAVVSLALGATGLTRLGLPNGSLATFPYAFLDGMTSESRARILGDHGASDKRCWRWGQVPPEAVLLVYGTTAEAIEALEAHLVEVGARLGAKCTCRIPLEKVTEGKAEPFGFADGISQPLIRGTYKAFKAPDQLHLVEPGEFVLGYPDNRGDIPPGPTLSALFDPDNRLPLTSQSTGFSRAVADQARDLGFNGTFLVIRELEQRTAAFTAYCEEESARLQGRLPAPYAVTAEFVAAKLVGRWPDGSSLVRHPYESRTAGKDRHAASADSPDAAIPSDDCACTPQKGDPARHASDLAAGRRPHVGDNGFLFGEDPEALRCPFGAHVRRANPRDSLDPGSAQQIAISNRHRILRVGRTYDATGKPNKGLFFMCLNGDIERQFEFLQQSWLRSPAFHGLSCEKDPVMGDGEEGNCTFTIPSRYGPVRLGPMEQFVETRGGGYFFLPGRRLIDYLAETTRPKEEVEPHALSGGGL